MQCCRIRGVLAATAGPTINPVLWRALSLPILLPQVLPHGQPHGQFPATTTAPGLSLAFVVVLLLLLLRVLLTRDPTLARATPLPRRVL